MPDIVKEYKSLVKLNDIIKELKPLLEKELSYQIDFEYKDYSSQLAEANSSAASYHYLLGIDFQKDMDKASQKKAAINFRGAPHIPGIIYIVNVPVKIAADNLLTEIYFSSES